jgi:hypothetical protein
LVHFLGAIQHLPSAVFNSIRQVDLMVLYEISTLDLKLKKSFRKFEVFIDEALFLASSRTWGGEGQLGFFLM